jgi:hypothetical protein
MKSILVFSHNHNSFDKKMLLENKEKDRFIKLSDKTVDDFVKDPSIKHFIMVTIDEFLEKYEPGDPKYKPDVLKQMSEMKERREKIIEHHKKEQDESKQKMNSIVNNSKNIDYATRIIGYLKQISSFSSARQMEEGLRFYDKNIINEK